MKKNRNWEKKKTVRCLMVAAALLLLALTASGCKAKFSEPEMEVLNLNYKLAEDEELEPFYASETKLYAGVLKRKPSRFAPSFPVTTEKFIVYDLVSGKVEAEYDPKEKDVYIYHAMPFEEGIIYAVYPPPEPNAPIEDGCPWYIKYISDEGIKTLDSGRCSSKFSMPAFAQLDGNVCYLYEIFDGNTERGFGISKADLNHPEVIVEETDYQLSDPEFYSNGTEYAILVDGKHDFLIGNAEEIYGKYDLPEPMSDFAICKDYLFCCTSSDDTKWTARSVSLKTGKAYACETEMNKPLYRIASMRGDEVTCISENWSMYILRPGKNYEIVPVEPREKDFPEAREFVRFYPYGETRTLAQLDDTKFCRITW